MTDRRPISTLSPETPEEHRSQRGRITETTWTWARFWRRYGSWVVTVINLTTFFTLWELASRAGMFNPLFLPAPSDMFAALWSGLTTSQGPGAVLSGSIRDHLGYTMRNLSIGVGIACVIGIPFGLMMGANRYIDAILSPYVWAIASTPRIALVPLFILIMGFTVRMQVTIIILSAVFPIIINSWAGVKTTEKSLLAAAKVFGAKRYQVYTKVIFPYTIPFIISGIQQGIGRGLVGVVIAEIFGGSKGLGYLISRAADTFNSPLLYAVLLILVIVSLTLVQTTRWLEARIAPWRKLDSV